MPEPTPPATQSVVVQPAAPAPPPLSANISILSEWALAIAAIAAVLGLLYKLVTREITRDVGHVKHKLDNTAARVDALEHLRTGDVERIARLEVAFVGIERGFDRIETRLGAEFGQLATSIREIRVVAARGDRS